MTSVFKDHCHSEMNNMIKFKRHNGNRKTERRQWNGKVLNQRGPPGASKDRVSLGPPWGEEGLL